MERTVSPAEGLRAPKAFLGPRGFLQSLEQDSAPAMEAELASTQLDFTSILQQTLQPSMRTEDLSTPVESPDYSPTLSNHTDYSPIQSSHTDYSVHPLVLGPGYSWEDIRVRPVNALDSKVGCSITHACSQVRHER